MNIHNFTNRQLCEYASIFPTVASLLDHLLFTVGCGYDIDMSSGMVVDGGNMRIDEYPVITQEQWIELIEQCHEKERGFAERFDRNGVVDEDYLAKNCARYKIVNVSDKDFTENALYEDLRAMVVERTKDRGYWGDEVMLRPYPLSENYSNIFHLNANTPAWFLQIGLNLCNAWFRFLSEELEAGRVWIKPSLRVKTPEDEERAIIAERLISEILGTTDRPNKEVYEEPESDYADVTWTTRHRDLIASQAQVIEQLLRK